MGAVHQSFSYVAVQIVVGESAMSAWVCISPKRVKVLGDRRHEETLARWTVSPVKLSIAKS
jgi:hypothetical protein